MKKVLIYTVVIVLIPVIVFFSAGIIFPSIDYETRVTINKPVDATFSSFTSTFKLLLWVPGLEGIGWVSGSQNVPGSKWVFIIKQNGEKHEMIQTLKAFKQDALFSFNTNNKLFTSDVEVKFINKGTATELVAVSHLTGKNIFWRSVFFFRKSFLKEYDQSMYHKFKEVTEK